MADSSAAGLAEAVLCENRDEAAALVAEQLVGDPPLALWTACRAWERDRLPLRSVEDLAQWLVDHALEVLQWPEASKGDFLLDDPALGERFSPLVQNRLALADLAALLSADRGQAAAEEAYLMGLLYEPSQWLAVGKGAGQPTGEGSPPQVPDWFQQISASEQVARAAVLLAEKTLPGPLARDVAGCRRRAEQACQRWLEPVGGPGDRLPGLMARLARLAELETRFAEVLERHKLDAMAEFAAGAGHEINNPLAIIGGRAQLLLKDERDPERRRELASIIAQVKRAHEMIADIRLFARPPKPEPERFDVVQLVDAVVEDFRPLVARQASTIRRTGRNEPLELEADPAQLQVALRAMCRNALEAIGHDGHIELHVDATGREAVIRISDDGPGIQPHQRVHLFEPFYSSRQAGRGLGTGLSKSWRIITAHGGRIEVDSQPGRGATFTIVLPRPSD